MHRLRKHGSVLVFSAFVVLFLIPVWWFDFFPTQDGPSHLYNALILTDFLWEDGSTFQNYLYLNPRFDPTWFSTSLLGLLTFVFPPLIAEKVLISACVLALPLAMRFAVRTVNPETEFVALLVFPFALSSLLHFGFFSYCLSLSNLLVFVGYFYRHNGDWTVRSAVVLAGLSFLLYLLNVVALGAAYLIVATIALTSIVTGGEYSWRSLARHGIKPLLAFLPTLALLFAFLGRRETILVFEGDWYARMKYATIPMSLFSFEKTELYVAAGMSLFLVTIAAILLFKQRQHRFSTPDAFALAAIVFCGLLLVVPSPFIVTDGGTPGGGFILERLNPIPWFLLILWISSRELGTLGRRVVRYSAVAFATIFLSLHMSTYAGLQDQMREYLSAADHIETGATILPLNIAPRGWSAPGQAQSVKADPYIHLSSHYGTERAAMVMQNYEADLGYFPIRFRAEINPWHHLGKISGSNSGPPSINLPRYMRETDVKIDYVTVWLGRKDRADHPDVKGIYSQLDEEFELIYVSPNGLLELFQFSP